MKYKANLSIRGNAVWSYSTHVATIDYAAQTLTIHGWHSVTTSKHVNHVAAELGLAKVYGNEPSQDKETDDGSSLLKTVAGVAALASIFTSTPAEANDWKARMLKAGLSNRGLMMPDNWDQLDEATKTARLDAALNAIS
jgi:hypothetical protein